VIDAMTSRKRSALYQLAERAGIQTSFVDSAGNETRRTPDDTIVALLAAMGFPASTDMEARATLESLDGQREHASLPPASIVIRREGAPLELQASLPHTSGHAAQWTLEITEENGPHHERHGSAYPDGHSQLTIALPDLPLGYHRVEMRVGEQSTGERLLIVAPPRCYDADEVLTGERAWGVTANLYAVRSARNWGIGDCTDLRRLLEWSGSLGGAFVGVNPLHALRNRGWDISPYSPLSRVYRNVLYIDVEAVPELGSSVEATERLRSVSFRADLARAREGDRVDYELVMALKRPFLEMLHRLFLEHHLGVDDARGQAFATYLHDEGETLNDFATFCALEEVLSAKLGKQLFDWREWPEEYRDARGPAVQQFRAEHAERIDFHRWLQFELDRQLGEVAEAARHAQMAIGLYQDLAIGSSPTGSEPWAMPDLFARGVSIGAPPDPLGPLGQNWGLPPVDPNRLAAQGYRYWTHLVRAAFAHSGALRIDHVMGLFRQFWIPDGRSGADGTYVQYPAEHLLAILALESVRAKALVVGEDLGTVPPEVPPALERWGILSSKVLYFERDTNGAFLPTARYPRSALATANTHDLATLRGFWEGRDIEIRRSVGIIGSDDHAAEELRRRDADRALLLDRLTSEGFTFRPHPDRDAIRSAVHSFLRRTPCWLVGLSLDDIGDERDAVNVPGTTQGMYPNWSRRMDTGLDELIAQPRSSLERALGVERAGP
jgi:4-alpha-glucanotransferase